MISRPSTRRTTLTGAILVAVALGAGACGGSADPKTTDDPTTSTSATPSPTSTPTASASPLSTFEDRPQVVTLRAWAIAQSQDINEGDRHMSRAAQFETAHGRDVVPRYAASDMGLYYPGPLPFTPVAVKESGRAATVTACWWAQGWAEKTSTHRPARKKQIVPVLIDMRKVDGHWLLDDVTSGNADCQGVPVKGVRW